MRLKRLFKKIVDWYFRPYKDEWDDVHPHLVIMDGGNARIETGEIAEFEIRRE